MKKLNLYLLLTMFLVGLPTLQSCDDDGYSLGAWEQRMATVRVISGDVFYLEIDNGEKLWIAAPAYFPYRPIDGQRVIARYTLLSDKYEEYDHMVQLLNIWDVLTKRIEDLTAENEEVFGDDKIRRINDIWVGGNYLNVVFEYNLPSQKRHRVSLVRNTTVEPANDGYIHLEYRYNNEDDVTNYWTRGRVSFDLGDYAPSLAVETYKGIKIRVNTEVEGIQTWTYDFSSAENDKEIDNSNESEENDEKYD